MISRACVKEAVVWVMLLGLFSPRSGFGELVRDGTVGPGGPIAGPHYQIDASSGRLVGENLFHSFDRFSISRNEIATFEGPAGVRHVLARVTGGTASVIDGTLRSELPNANLYVLNPSGVIFGPNAKLEVPGSFAVSTADYVELADGTRFSAAAPANPVLTAAPPVAFGFLEGKSAAAIDVNGASLAVSSGKGISTISGPLRLVAAKLDAPGGAVRIVSVASGGTVSVAPGEFAGARSDVSLRGSRITTDGDAAGPVSIVANHVQMRGSLASAVSAASDGDDLSIDARTLDIASGSSILTATAGTGQGGDIRVMADAVRVDGGGANDPFTAIQTLTLGSGPGGSIVLGHPTRPLVQLTVEGAGAVAALSQGPGGSGDVNIHSTHIAIDGKGFSGFTGIASNTQSPVPGGPGGALNITAETIHIFDRGGIVANTFSPGAPAGSVRIRSRDLVIDGRGATEATGIDSISGLVNSQSPLGGPGGAIDLVVEGALRIINGGSIRTNTSTSFPAGRLQVIADTVEVDRAGSPVETGIGAQVERSGTGNGGALHLTANTLTVRNGGRISVTTTGTGSAGKLHIAARDIFMVGGQIESTSELPSPGAGAGGAVAVDASRSIQLFRGSRISARAAAADAGNLSVNALDMLRLDGSQITTESELAGGDIRIDPQFVVMRQSQITADAVQKSGGNITMVADHFVPSIDSAVTASSEQATPGIIDINAQRLDAAATLSRLPATLSDEVRLQELCGVRVGGSASSFVVTGRGALPPEPDVSIAREQPLSLSPARSGLQSD